MSSEIRVVIVTNVPAPYRVPVWRRVAGTEGINLNLIFCARPHIDTQTHTAEYGFDKHFLTGRYLAMEQRFMHCDPGVWGLLNKLQPDVVITTGYIPTFLFAFAWALWNRVSHVAMSDGTLFSEQRLTVLHRLVRRMVLGRSKSFIGACDGSRQLFRHYGVDEAHIHLSYLCADNSKFNLQPRQPVVDFIYCGRFIAHKRPLFVMEVAKEAAKRLGRKTSVDFVGSGEMEASMREFANEISEYVECRFLGYATQQELPERYAQARIFLFPSEWDPWGVVANEACAAGLPVIVSPYAGVAMELIVDGVNGYVRELQCGLWVDAAVNLLADEVLYRRFAANSLVQVAKYTFENSAAGMLDAIRQAYSER